MLVAAGTACCSLILSVKCGDDWVSFPDAVFVTQHATCERKKIQFFKLRTLKSGSSVTNFQAKPFGLYVGRDLNLVALGFLNDRIKDLE